MKFVDPDGREVKNRKKKQEAFFDSFKSDKFGTEIVLHYLYGKGAEKKCSTPEWQNYMRKNERFRYQVLTEILDHFNEKVSSFEDSMTFSFTFHGELENSERMEGYSYLHGSNKTVGDVFVFVEVNKNGDNGVILKYQITWNDIININTNYDSDIIKNTIAKIVSFGNCQEYIIEITWNDEFRINDDGTCVFGE